jgi:hypothetical protein
MVATFAPLIKGKGRRNHWITSLNDEREVVPVRITFKIKIKISRHPKNKPELKPSQVRPGMGRLAMGLPGTLNEWAIITIPIKNKKYLISINILLMGSPQQTSAVTKMELRMDNEKTRPVIPTAIVNRIMQVNLKRPSR